MLREAYLSADAPRQRELTRQRHSLVPSLVQTARDKAASARKVRAQTTERLTETLDATLVDPGYAAQQLRVGQLTTALHREILGIQLTTGEDGAGWLAFFRDLTARARSGSDSSQATSPQHPAHSSTGVGRDSPAPAAPVVEARPHRARQPQTAGRGRDRIRSGSGR